MGEEGGGRRHNANGSSQITGRDVSARDIRKRIQIIVDKNALQIKPYISYKKHVVSLIQSTYIMCIVLYYYYCNT